MRPGPAPEVPAGLEETLNCTASYMRSGGLRREGSCHLELAGPLARAGSREARPRGQRSLGSSLGPQTDSSCWGTRAEDRAAVTHPSMMYKMLTPHSALPPNKPGGGGLQVPKGSAGSQAGQDRRMTLVPSAGRTKDPPQKPRTQAATGGPASPALLTQPPRVSRPPLLLPPSKDPRPCRTKSRT